MFRPNVLTRLRSYFWPVLIEKRQGDLDQELEVLVYHGKLMLDTKEVNYSFGTLHEVMQGVLGKLQKRRYPIEEVLILGYGGGSAASIIHNEIRADAQIIGVEADKQVVELTEKYFYKSGVKLLHEDAFHYVARAVKQEWQYDTIIIDLFVNGNTPKFNDTFWLQIKHLLTPDGVAFVNTMLPEKEFQELGKEITSFGFETQAWNDIRENRVWVFRK